MPNRGVRAAMAEIDLAGEPASGRRANEGEINPSLCHWREV
jgi:hypothetical protein